MEGKRSWEFVAIPVVLVMFGILAIIMWAADAGMWPWIAVGLVALAALVGVTVSYMRRPHHPAGPPPVAAHVDDGVHRLLVIADAACGPADLGSALGSGRVAVHVIAPALGSRTERWTGDDHAYQDAQRHLDVTLRDFAAAGIDAHGHVGPHDPLQAADDGLREFPADGIVFAVHESDRRNWLEEGVVESARSRYPVPVDEVTVAVTAPA